MRITRQDIIHHRKMRKQGWHDSAWHIYMSSLKAQAIDYALYLLPIGNAYRDIQAAANSYIHLQEKEK